jgi:hypothetical protein
MCVMRVNGINHQSMIADNSAASDIRRENIDYVLVKVSVNMFSLTISGEFCTIAGIFPLCKKTRAKVSESSVFIPL